MPVRLLAVLLLLLTACETVPTSPDRPPAREAPNAPPERVVPLFQAADTDSNGKIDALLVVVYLFPASNASALPVWAEGQFQFTLHAEEGDPLAEWTFPLEQVLRHRDTDSLGRTHSFTLDIKAAAGTDDFPPQNASLSAAFIRADGVTVRSAGNVSIRLGSN